MADDISRRDRRDMIQEALERISQLSGVNLSEGNRTRPEENRTTSFNDELARRFPTLRTNDSSTSTAVTARGSSSSSRQFCLRGSSTTARSASTFGGRKRKRKAEKVGKTVHKDLILVPDPNEEQVPMHVARVALETEGKVVHGFPVETQWDAKTLRKKIVDQFPRLIACPFEYTKVSFFAFVIFLYYFMFCVSLLFINACLFQCFLCEACPWGYPGPWQP